VRLNRFWRRTDVGKRFAQLWLAPSANVTDLDVARLPALVPMPLRYDAERRAMVDAALDAHRTT
jgi:hypothetical protein